MFRASEKILCYCSLLIMSVVICGCGNPAMVDESQSVEITGVVTLDGKPLNDAEVTFLPADGDPLVGPALVITDSQGSYTMSVNAPREYKVNVDRMMNGGPNPKLKEYQGEATSLTANVSADSKTFNFDLKSAQ
ncbi:hypothetical protein Pan153_41370 [Gimesia panareensis]|uniref:Carboxypeptidase regulatory-like domain-containing protein n=2 Tax=Gimesia panareensis TaxID=2527978 RepID=A0A518FSZ2_9PLAN|nr:hypothetical protein Pan153_41370 [Gimesia panareensis]